MDPLTGWLTIGVRVASACLAFATISFSWLICWPARIRLPQERVLALGIAALAVCGVCDTRVRWLPRFCCSGSATGGAEAIVALWAGACGFCLGQSCAVSGLR